jgi:hypothetical protein
VELFLYGICFITAEFRPSCIIQISKFWKCWKFQNFENIENFENFEKIKNFKNPEKNWKFQKSWKILKISKILNNFENFKNLESFKFSKNFEIFKNFIMWPTYILHNWILCQDNHLSPYDLHTAYHKTYFRVCTCDDFSADEISQCLYQCFWQFQVKTLYRVIFGKTGDKRHGAPFCTFLN